MAIAITIALGSAPRCSASAIPTGARTPAQAMLFINWVMTTVPSHRIAVIRYRFVLEENDSIRELARLLGGAEITPAVLENAKEMKELAQKQKNTRLK